MAVENCSNGKKKSESAALKPKGCGTQILNCAIPFVIRRERRGNKSEKKNRTSLKTRHYERKKRKRPD
jgi:hypothetical protein